MAEYQTYAERILAIDPVLIATLTAQEIADRIDAPNRQAVYQTLKQAGLAYRRTRKGPPDLGRRDAVRPHLDSDMTAAEIGALIGITPSAVRGAIHRLRQQEGRSHG